MCVCVCVFVFGACVLVDDVTRRDRCAVMEQGVTPMMIESIIDISYAISFFKKILYEIMSYANRSMTSVYK